MGTKFYIKLSKGHNSIKMKVVMVLVLYILYVFYFYQVLKKKKKKSSMASKLCRGHKFNLKNLQRGITKSKMKTVTDLFFYPHHLTMLYSCTKFLENSLNGRLNRQIIHMKCQALFTKKNKYFRMLSPAI